MIKLVSLVFLGLALLMPICSAVEIELPALLAQLRSEIAFLQKCLMSIDDELNQTKIYMNSLLERNEAERIALQSRIEYYETVYNQLVEEKEKLEKDYQVLAVSRGFSIELKTEFDSYRKNAETAIKIWRAAAIIVPAVLVTIYLVKTLVQAK